MGEHPGTASAKVRGLAERLRLKHLEDLLLPADLAGLPEAIDLADLVSSRGAPELFLGTFSEEDIAGALQRYGVSQRLIDKGLGAPEVHIDTSERARHTMRIFCPLGEHSALVAETALRLGDYQTEAPFARPLHGHRLRMLYALWLLMQDPRADFDAQRPALPGQHRPGLQMAHYVDHLFRGLARRMDCDGVVNCPEFYHTAVFYSQSYRFLDPAKEGLLAALRRDLAGLSLAGASWGIHTGCVLERLPSGEERAVHWEPEEQILALREPLLSYFASDHFRTAVAKHAATLHFRFDRERWERISPLRPDGKPRNTAG